MTHKDFRTAYLNAHLTEPIYMNQPEGFVKQGEEHKVCILNKALYGLKQAGRSWQETLFRTLNQNHLKQSTNEPCIWFQKTGELVIIIGIYVDDLIITGNDKKKIQEISQVLHKTYRLKDLGKAKRFLGIEIIQFENKTFITQQSYIQELIEKFKQKDCKPEPTPATGVEINDSDIIECTYPIREALGALMFIANATRPDICYIVNKLSRHVSRPTTHLWRQVQRVLKYMKGTTHFGLLYGSGRPCDQITMFADRSFGDDKKDRKSTTGWISFIGNDIIYWRSTKQKSVALSTTESEYMACCEAAKEAKWTRNLIRELLDDKNKPVTIFQDNQSTIFLANNNATKRRTKHIDIRYHFIREQIQEGVIQLQYCETENMIADILTKSLGKTLFQKHRDKILFASQLESNRVDFEGAC